MRGITIEEFVQEWGKTLADKMITDLREPLKKALYAMITQKKPSLARYVSDPNDMFDDLESFDLESAEEANNECIIQIVDALDTYVRSMYDTLEQMSQSFRD